MTTRPDGTIGSGPASRADPTPGMHRVRHGPVTLHVDERPGRGAPVLVLHGFTGCAEAMAPVLDALAAVGRHSLTPDLVGHGRSTTDAPDAAFTMDACVGQLTAVLDALDVGSVHVVGYSMGGRVALSLAAADPDRLRSLCLVGASPGLASEVERDARRRTDDDLARSIVADGVTAFAARWAAQPLFATQRRRLDADRLDTARRQRAANDAHGLARSLRGMGTGAMPPLHDRLPRIEVPTVVLAGADDTKFCAIGRAIAAAMPDAALAVVPDAGHAAHLENPIAVGAALTALLDRTDPLR